MGKQLRFGLYRFDVDQLVLKKAGHVVKLPQQSALLLALLLERAGQVVSREEMRERIWPEGTHVEFDSGLNTAMNRIRRALDDSARVPRFVETVPRVGYRFIGDCELDVEEGNGPVVEEDPGRGVWWKRRWVWAAALVALVGLGWSVGRVSRGGVQGPSVRSSISLPERHFGRNVRISPNGEKLAYLSGRNVYIRYLNRDESIRINGIEEVMAFDFSPDGKELALWSPDSLQVYTGNGLDVVLRPTRKMQVSNAVWTKSGYLYYSDQGLEQPAIFRVKRRGGEPELVKQLPDHYGKLTFPILQHLSEDEEMMLYTSLFSPTDRTLMAMRGRRGLEPAQDVEVLQKAMGGLDLKSGHLMYFWGGSVYAAAWDRERLKLSGAPVKVLDRVVLNTWQGGAMDVSEDGTLVFVPEPPREGRKITVTDESGRRIELDMPSGEYEQVRCSPAGDRLAVVRRDGVSLWSVWIFELKTKAWTHLLDESQPFPRLVWSPDGQALAVALVQGGQGFVNLYRVPIANPKAMERLTEQARFGQFPTDWSGKRNEIVFEEGYHPQRKSDLMALRMDGLKVRPLQELAGRDLDGMISPDGKWMAYAAEPDGQLKVYVRAVDGKGLGTLVSEIAGRSPVWSEKGDRLWFLSDNKSGLIEVAVKDGQPVGAATPKFGKTASFIPDFWTRSFDVSGKGLLYAIELPSELHKRGTIEVVTNWFRELERMAPTGR